MLFGAMWMGAYLRGGFGSNAQIMLNPGSAPLAYLAELPIRSLVLLSALVVPLNPFLFYLRPSAFIGLVGFCVIGGAALAAILLSALRRDRGREGVLPMALWTMMYLPLLVCTVPDDRILMLPGIGFAFLAGVWLTRGLRSSRRGITRWAAALFLVAHPLAALVVCQGMTFIESRSDEALRAAVDGFGRGLRAGDCVFFINCTLDSNVLFAQQRFRTLTGRDDVLAAYLTDVERPEIERVNDHTLRFEAHGQMLFDGFIGEMTSSTERPKRVGDTFAAGELTGRITAMSGGLVSAVEVEFRKPLENDAYRFYECGSLGLPRRWTPPPVRQP